MIRILFLFFFTFPAFAILCPGGVVPSTTSYQYALYWPVSPYQTCASADNPSEACLTGAASSSCSSGGPYYGNWNTSTNQCQIFKTSNNAYQGVWPTLNSCPSGYIDNGTNCVLSNPPLVQCEPPPPPDCPAGASAGFGPASTTLLCVNDCAVKPKGMTAAELDNNGIQIGVKLAEWVATGEPCSVVVPPPPVSTQIDPNKSNCITNGTKQLCISSVKPGCGTVNGKEWCPDQVGCGTVNGQRVCVPDDGGCTPVGGLDFACTKNATPPPAPPNEPPPVVDFKASVPVQDAPAPTGGNPSTGAVPNTPGSDTGGTAPVTIGHYPGNSGNGTGQNPDNGGTGGNIDTSGLAQESSLQSLGGLVTQIRDSLGGSLSGSGFSASTPGSHDNVNISPDITAKQTELSTKLSQVKAEFGQLLSFGSSTSAQALQCPANSGFTFYGTTISLCTQSVLSATATIGNVLIFLAFVVSLFILLS